MRDFAPPPLNNSAPKFSGVRAQPGQKYAVEWVKRQLRKIHRQARLAGRPSPLNEAAAHLYLLIATYVLDRNFVSEAMLLQELVGIMHCKPITVRKARKRLEALREIKLVDGGQGKAEVRFALLKMAGPLYVEQGGAPGGEKSTTSVPEIEATSMPEIEARENFDPYGSKPQSRTCVARDRGTRDLRSVGVEVAADDYMYLVEEDQTTTSDDAARAEQLAALRAANDHDERRTAEFCEWWTARFPAYHQGVLNTLRPCDRESAFALLSAPRTIERVQAMALEAWTVRPDGNPNSNRSYVATSDHSIRVVLEKATFLEMEVVKRGPILDDDSPTEPAPERDVRDELVAHVERVKLRLEECTRATSVAVNTQLQQAIASALDELLQLRLLSDRQQVSDRLYEIEVTLLDAARAGTDVAILSALDAEADRELADFGGGMTEEARQRAQRLAVARLLRERYRLPLVAWAAPNAASMGEDEEDRRQAAG